MPTVYLNIGSNQGDRHSIIERAVEMLQHQWPHASLRRAPYIESEPWGYASKHQFLNLGLAFDFDCEIDPYAVHDVTQGVERALGTSPHRNADGTYRDRSIDIDIIAIDDRRIDSKRLKLPHPRAAQRDFVTIPLQALGYDLQLLHDDLT